MINLTAFNSQRIKQQRGAVLAVSLIMLLLLTLIGITSAQVTGLEEKMTGNMRARNMAFQASETALRAAETFLTQATLPAFTPTGINNGLYSETATPPKQNDNWLSFNYSTTTFSQTASQPLYVIQRLNNIGKSSLDAGDYTDNEFYRITARGVGGTSNAVVVLQSFYKR
jgi:type IV pilus assembly protein PilX